MQRRIHSMQQLRERGEQRLQRFLSTEAREDANLDAPPVSRRSRQHRIVSEVHAERPEKSAGTAQSSHLVNLRHVPRHEAILAIGAELVVWVVGVLEAVAHGM